MGWLFFAIVIFLIIGAVANALKESGRRKRASKTDIPEKFDFYRANSFPANGNYRIKYRDFKGDITEREILPKTVFEDKGRYSIGAFCLLRNEYRTFVVDRIQEIINLETGETDVNIARDAIRQFNNSGTGHAKKALEQEKQGVSVLVYVCRADGKMLKPERKIIAEYIKHRCPETVFDDHSLDTLIKTIGDPTETDFGRIIQKLKHSPDQDNMHLLFDFAKRIVGTQKTSVQKETDALDNISAAIKTLPQPQPYRVRTS